MSNEEQIISMLTSMQTDINARLDKIEANQTTMQADISGLKAGQESMQADITGFKTSQAETNQKLERLTIKVDALSDKTDRVEAHAIRIDSAQTDILGRLESLAAEDKNILESMYKFADFDRERYIQMMNKIDTIQRVTRLNSSDITELRAASMVNP